MHDFVNKPICNLDGSMFASGIRLHGLAFPIVHLLTKKVLLYTSSLVNGKYVCHPQPPHQPPHQQIKLVIDWVFLWQTLLFHSEC